MTAAQLQRVRTAHLASVLHLSRTLLRQPSPKWLSCHLVEVSLAIRTLTESKVQFNPGLFERYLETVDSHFISHLPFSAFGDFYLAAQIALNLHQAYDHRHKKVISDLLSAIMLCQRADGGWGFRLYDEGRVSATARLLAIFHNLEVCLPFFHDQIQLGYQWLCDEWKEELDREGLLFKGGLYLQAMSKTDYWSQNEGLIAETIQLLAKHQLDDGAWSYLKPTNHISVLADTKSVGQTATIVIGLIDIYEMARELNGRSRLLPAISRGIDYLLEAQNAQGFWAEGGDVDRHLRTTCLCTLSLARFIDLSARADSYEV